MPLHPEVQALLNAMRELEAFLAERDATWSASIRQAADEVANSDAHGLRRFLSFFGGSGTLNDLILTLAWENIHLAALLRKTSRLADELRDELY